MWPRRTSRASNILPIVARLEFEGHRSLGAIARQLNAEGVPTISGRGKEWTAMGVKLLKARVSSSYRRLLRIPRSENA